MDNLAHTFINPSPRRGFQEEAEQAVGVAKRAYYDALNARHRALRAIARERA